MKRARAHALLFLALLTPASAQTLLTTEHVDLGLNFRASSREWLLTSRDEDHTTEYAAQNVLHFAGANTRLTIPNNPNFTFLGTPGSSVWILPQSRLAGALFLGVSTENKTLQSGWIGVGVDTGLLVRGVDPGTFLNDQVTFSLTSLSGPGNFFLYTATAFGAPTVYINTADGVSEADAKVFSNNEHTHFNWAFSTPGLYRLTFRASGILAADGTTVTSEEFTYFFGVETTQIPEPGVVVWCGLCTALWAWRARGRRRLSRSRGKSPVHQSPTPCPSTSFS